MDNVRDLDSCSGDLAPVLAQFESTVLGLWQDALRFALEMDGATERCGRRACRREGACQMQCVEGRPLACGGGEICDDTLKVACAAAFFGAIVFMREPRRTQ